MIFTVEPMINLGRPHVKLLVGRLDGGHPRPLALGAVRAHGRRHRDRRRDLHALADGPLVAALEDRASEESGPPPMGRSSKTPAAFRIFTATATGCAPASAIKGAAALADYELLEMALFRALPRGDTKPLAKALLKRFGTLAEVLAAPRERLEGSGRASATASSTS